MSMPGHVVAWAEQPGPARMLAEARARAEAGRLGPRAQLAIDLDADERRQVGRMLDAAWASSGEPVRVSRLRVELARHGTTLEELLLLGGPLRDLRAERRAAEDAKRDDHDRGRDRLLALAGHVDRAVVERCLVGAASWTERAERIAEVVEHLDRRAASGDEPLRLPVLAAQLFRDAHALDRTQGLGRAVARFLAGRAVDDPAGWADPVGDASAWHRAWESGGVVCDGVSAQVLVLNLPLTGGGPAAALAAVRGEPVWLTLRSLLAPFALADGAPEVFVCENPAIVEAAADRYGPDSRPLVCTFGLPNLAATTLLSSLASTATLRVRADGDAVGWRIVDRLLLLPGARPWRMPAGFDRYEEEILDELLEDLAPGRAGLMP